MASGDIFEPGDLVVVVSDVWAEGYDLSGLIGTVVSHDSYVMVQIEALNIRGRLDKKIFKLFSYEVDALLDLPSDDFYIP